MANFDNYLNATSGLSEANFTGYRHATKLYLTDNYKRAPKFGHMYFVKFNVNQSVIKQVTAEWDRNFTALLCKEVQLPKFKISTETINQYNRKTNVQTKIAYEALNFSFHDDMGGTTNGFWTNYYKYYYADSRYGDASAKPNLKTVYGDTKYSGLDGDYTYGFNPVAATPTGSSAPYFLESIDIYLLHAGPSHKDYTRFRLVNPLISSWDHDSVTQGEASKVLQNKMTVVYEDVIYSSGKMQNASDDSVLLFEDPAVYDRTPTPLTSGAGGKAPNFEYLRDGFGGVSEDLSDFTAQIPQPPTWIPPPPAYQKSGLSIGQLINAYNIAKTFKTQPRQAWNIYGINVKNLLTSSAIGAISSNPANVVGQANFPAGYAQGNLSYSQPNIPASAYVNTALIQQQESARIEAGLNSNNTINNNTDAGEIDPS